MKDVQIIDDTFVGKMLANPGYLRAFSFLRPYAELLKTKAAECGTCGGASNNRPTIDYDTIKRTLASMPNHKQVELLKLTASKSAIVFFKNLAGKPDRRTIGPFAEA